jgi:hypothetical protein
MAQILKDHLFRTKQLLGPFNNSIFKLDTDWQQIVNILDSGWSPNQETVIHKRSIATGSISSIPGYSVYPLDLAPEYILTDG